MTSSNISGGSDLHDWIEIETRQLDIVASWESLCDAYAVLGFSDPMSDAMRLEEFKWIIHEMNRHLSRARKQLLSCRDAESMAETLASMFSPTGAQNISGRKDLAYQKLKQSWVKKMLSELSMKMETMEGEDQDGPEYE